MTDIFHINQSDLAWSAYTTETGPAAIRYKALTLGAAGVPSVQYIEYGPGQTDPVHSHEVGVFFIVAKGDMWVNNDPVAAGGLVFIPAKADYQVRAGDNGVEYYRVVVR
jgi:hypothetical protein